jgi:hypothetical protein
MDIINLTIAGSGALLMLYTGMSFSFAELKTTLNRKNLTSFYGLTAINYFIIPLLTYLVVALILDFSALGLALLTLAVLPCAPLVPSLVALLDEPPEWSLLIFILYSLLSTIIVLALASVIAFHDNDSAHKIYQGFSRFIIIIYLPMGIGILCRRYITAWTIAAARFLRPIAGAILLLVLILFAAANINEIKAIRFVDLSAIFIFNGLCIAIVIPLKTCIAGPLLTRLLTTGFRNMALALPFSILVINRIDVSVYIVIYGLVAITTCSLALFFLRLYKPNTSF